MDRPGPIETTARSQPRPAVKVRRHADAAAFLRRAEPWLLQTEAANNLTLGVARRFAHARPDPERYWATIERDGIVCGSAFRTPPHRLALTIMPLEAVAPLAGALGEIYAELPGVGGPRHEVQAFARVWARTHGVGTSLRLRLGVHELTRVRFPSGAPSGSLRLAGDGDVPLVREWWRSFVADTGILATPWDLVERVLAAGRLHLWDDDGPRAMVAAARETARGASINAVYTPPEFRRRGYATVAVATLSRRLLDGGKSFCCLYTDLANPTSNSIYRRIGYVQIREDCEIDFVGSRAPYPRPRHGGA